MRRIEPHLFWAVWASILLLGCSPDSGGSKVPETCGNGVVDEGEECDGTDLDGATCTSLGYSGGTLGCTEACAFDTSGCSGGGGGECGNGVIDAGEECDGTQLGGKTCQDLGYTGGTLGCTDQCYFDTSRCSSETCGNGVIESGEECDGTNLGGASCESLGHLGGLLRCQNCRYDESGCTDDEVVAVCQRWNSDVSEARSGQWTGSVEQCDPGDYLSPGRESALKLTNLYRWLAGLDPVTEDPSLDDKAQKCALIQHARGGLTHHPSESDPCYTAEGAEAASHSNIATSNAVDAVHMYMSDFGNENTMGHRRWILSTWYTRAGFGSTSGYSCQWVINGMGGSGPSWIAFPSPGVFPYQAMNMSYRSVDDTGWTIQSDSINVGSATIKVYEDGVEKPVQTYSLPANYGSSYAVRIAPQGWSSSPGHTYTVEVTAGSTTFSYDVIMVDCSAYQ